MRTKTAAVKDGIVADVEVWDSTNPPSERSDGLPRIECPEWVETGCTHNGTEFRMPDGSRVRQKKLDEIADEDDRNELVERIIALKDVIPLLRQVTGTQGERIKRIEEAMVPIIRLAIRQNK